MQHEDSVDTLAARQHGVVARHQLLAAGLSRAAIDHRLATGRMRPLHAGVYLLGGHPESFTVRLVAACLTAGPAAVVSHRAAAFLHGLAGVDGQVEVSVPRDKFRRLGGVRLHRVATLGRADVERVDGIARTRVTRTLVDLASVVPAPTLESALDDALARRLVTCGYLRRRLDAAGRRGRKGAGTLARMLDDRSGTRAQPESTLERRLLALLRTAGLPRPVPQFPVDLPGGGRRYLDLAYPEQLLALEGDSYLHHSSKIDWAADRTRNGALAALGWRIIPVTWDDLDPAAAPALVAIVARGLNGLPRLAG